jgi:hypothetical protein
MPWKEHSVMEERFRFIEEWNSDEFSLAELCRFYGISRGTVRPVPQVYGLRVLRQIDRALHLALVLNRKDRITAYPRCRAPQSY